MEGPGYGTAIIFGLREHLEKLSEHGDPLEVLDATVDFEYFRGWLLEGLGYGDGRKGGRPPFDPVSMFKALILQAQHNLSDARMEFMIRDRLSWMRFLGFDLGDPTPDENTIRLFRNKLTESGALKRVMKAFDWQLQKKGYGISPSKGPNWRAFTRQQHRKRAPSTALGAQSSFNASQSCSSPQLIRVSSLEACGVSQ